MSDMFDFGFGLVPARKHPNGGGWVAETATVVDSAHIGPEAQVFGDARVSGIPRSDGYFFSAFRCQDGLYRVAAGCRYFTWAEADEHWENPEYRNPALAKETKAILALLKIQTRQD